LARTVLANEIYTSSDLPGNIPIPLHHEKPRSPNPPHHLYFCCATQPQSGGGTLFANAADIWQDMPASIRDKIIKYGVNYQQFFHHKCLRQTLLSKFLGKSSTRTLSEHFGTENPAQIETKLKQDHSEWTWINKGKDLLIKTHLPGALKHPITHQTVWFNGSSYLNCHANVLNGDTEWSFIKALAYRYLIANNMFPMLCNYGDDEAFSAIEIAEINHIILHHTGSFQWQKGDFMIVDNYTLMHGKQAHQGERLLYSCMTRMLGV
jgi:hypothetical protein